MGLGRDYLADPSPEGFWEATEPGNIWVTEDGRKIPIVDLSDEHLLNIMIMLEEKNNPLAPITREYERRANITVPELSSY